MSETESVLVEISCSKALISCVEEGEEIVLLHDSGDLGPLFGSRINTSGVVGAGVQ